MDIDRMDWDKLRVFRAVAELQSMSAAATRLGESPPTVSRKISDLETALNTELFHRSTRGVELTDTGQRVFKHVCAMADAAEAFHAEAADTNALAEGKVTLVTGEGIGAHWIAPRLPKLHKEYPRIELSLLVSDTPPNLLNGEADIAIQFTEPKNSDLIMRRLGILHYMLFTSEEYIATYGAPASWYEFIQHRCIFHSSYVHQMERWAPKTVELKKIIDCAVVTNSGAAMLEVCAAGGGIAALPSYVADVRPDLVPLELPELAPIEFWLTYTERVRRLPRGRVVIDWLRSIFEPQVAPWFRETFIHPNEMRAHREKASNSPSSATKTTARSSRFAVPQE